MTAPIRAKRRKADVTDQQIIDHYLTTNSGQKTAKALGVGGSLVLSVLRKNKIERKGLELFREDKKFLGQESDIRADYESGMTLKQLGEKYPGGSDWSLKAAIKRAGGTLRDISAVPQKTEEVAEIRRLHALGMTQAAIADQLGRSQSFVTRLAKKEGIVFSTRARENHGSWKGGRITNQDGYVRVIMERDDPLYEMADHSSYVAEHRIVMARSLNRPLLPTETVHHKNGNTTDNSLENLQLRQGRHGKHIHLTCLDCGSHNIEASEI